MTKQGRVHPEGALPPLRDADGLLFRAALSLCASSGIIGLTEDQGSFLLLIIPSRLEPAAARGMASCYSASSTIPSASLYAACTYACMYTTVGYANPNNLRY